MSSEALRALERGLEEVKTLAAADPTRPGGLPVDPPTARAVGRGCVVLLVGHLEGYLASVNEEATAAVTAAGVSSDSLPESLRLRHSRSIIDTLAATIWMRRAAALKALAEDEMWLWRPGATGRLVHDRLIEGVTSPMPDDLVRYYSLWGIKDVFSAITRRPTTRSQFWLGLTDVVDKRHAIAHGDSVAEATKKDVLGYIRVVATFAARADRLLARHLRKHLGVPIAW